MVTFRNNVGKLIDRIYCPVCQYKLKGAPPLQGDYVVAYGVCNPGGSDLIGWKSIEITPDMVGKRVAVFVAIETKVGRRGATAEQDNFLAQVSAAGGIAVLSRDVDATVKEVCGG